jgi:hypothetical protein
MAQHYGKPAYGAAEQIANATAPQAPQLFIVVAMAAYFIGAFQITRTITAHTGFILSVLIWIIAIWLTLGFRDEAKYQLKRLGARINPKRTRYEQRVNQVYNQLYEAAHGKTLRKDQFSSNQFTWAIGGVQEIRTAEKLKKYYANEDEVTIVDDITLYNNHGDVTANIDHLILGPYNAIMIDSKVWREAPRFTTHPSSGKRYIPKTSPHWDSVSTCIYEANQLPVQPAAIIFIVGGQAAKTLEKTGPQRVWHFHGKFEESQTRVHDIEQPVIFCATKDLESTLTNIRASLPYRPLSVKDLKKAKNIKF